ncbi:MAG: acetylxylan esterase [Bacteroidia bacterium]|nr:acetylxylan esterase [Bacteroidia bacterium]
MNYYKRFFLLTISCLFTFQLWAQENMLCQGAYWSEDEGNKRMKEFAELWNDKDSWEERASAIKTQMKLGMQWEKMPQLSGNFNPIIRKKRIMDGYSVENIAIESFPGFYITGNLYRPLQKTGKHAAILSPHGHWENGRMREAMQIRCAALARMGAIVFAYDMLGYGESQQLDHNIPIALHLQTFNSKRVLEYLLSREDVDGERIGMTGASGGGTQTFVLSALDERIKAAVPAIQISAHFFGGCVCESGMPIHKSEHLQTNNVEIGALMAPRPMLMLSDGGDWTRNTPRVEYPYIRKVYALYDAEHKLEQVHFPSERHDYGYSKRTPMYMFFAHHLKLNINMLEFQGPPKEDFFQLLSEEELQVFDKEHPLPANALKGDASVLKYLGW